MAAESSSMFALCFDAPYNELVHTFHLARDSVSVPEYSKKVSVGSAWLPQRGPKSSDRTTLASYIRLFEPMVIKALKYYTLTSDVEHQSRVLQLLICLVKLRVNYCLLDSEQVLLLC
jgi:huntingtin